MATINQIEIYKQRYETYRHLDRLRWQMLQIAVGAGSLILAFAGGDSEPNWWIFAAVGLLLIIFGSVMLRIGHGINMNGKVLSKAASAVGDVDIPSDFKAVEERFLLGRLCFNCPRKRLRSVYLVFLGNYVFNRF